MVPQTDPSAMEVRNHLSSQMIKSAIEAINISCDICAASRTAAQQRKLYCNGYPHINIEGNECADSLAKEARDIEHKCTTITLDDANAVAKHRIMNHTFKNP
ncbi:hypothetical protein TNCV_2912061 [Trichonephila clavipes]|nr:hypothetical protein TNCV_2912061 [Trichonephila clavipes]